MGASVFTNFTFQISSFFLWWTRLWMKITSPKVYFSTEFEKCFCRRFRVKSSPKIPNEFYFQKLQVWAVPPKWISKSTYRVDLRHGLGIGTENFGGKRDSAHKASYYARLNIFPLPRGWAFTFHAHTHETTHILRFFLHSADISIHIYSKTKNSKLPQSGGGWERKSYVLKGNCGVWFFIRFPNPLPGTPFFLPFANL